LPGICDPYLNINGDWQDGYKIVRAKDVTDGLGKTYLVTEKTLDTDQYETGGGLGDLGNIWYLIKADLFRMVMNPPSADVPIDDSLLVRVILNEIATEEADGLFGRRGGKADQESIEVFEYLSPNVVNGAMTVVSGNSRTATPRFAEMFIWR
jgi:hypothetical protein